jgi:GNAT superfamily N-acetyltransferase
MAINIHTGNAGDMHRVFPMLYGRLEERAAVDPAYFALRPNAPARFRRWIGPALEDPRHALVVAEEAGEIVGCLAATVEQDLPIYVCDEYAIVRVLWVDPHHRGRGIAGRMLEHAAGECGRFGLRQLRASAAVGREIEKHVLKKAGFRAAGITFLRELRPAAADADPE